MNSVETKISGSQMEQCQVNMVGEVKDPSQVHAALFFKTSFYIIVLQVRKTAKNFRDDLIRKSLYWNIA